MTNPIDPTPESNESAAEYRVSAQELSHIVHILQARKEAEARQRANTVALGDAIDQLGLEMTPDELMAEIRADRNRRAGGSRPKRQNNTQRRTFATFAVCAGLAAMMVSSIQMHRMNRVMWAERNSPLYTSHDYIYEGVPGPTDSMNVTLESSDALPATTAGQFRPFSEYDENERADCDFDSLRSMANGRPQAQVQVQANDTNEDSLWTIVKQDGEVKVFAFGTDAEFAKAVNGHPAHLYASTHDGLQDQLLPLRLFQNADQIDTPGKSGAELNPDTKSPFANTRPTQWTAPSQTDTDWQTIYSGDKNGYIIIRR